MDLSIKLLRLNSMLVIVISSNKIFMHSVSSTETSETRTRVQHAPETAKSFKTDQEKEGQAKSSYG